MEIYNFYNFIASIMDSADSYLRQYAQANPNYNYAPIFPNMASYLWTILGSALGVWLGFFLLQAFGLYSMAKKQNRSDKYLAFIPFAQTFYMSKLAGKCAFFGRPMKNAGVYVLISEIAYVLVGGMAIAAKMYLYLVCGEPTPIYENIAGMQVITGYVWTNLTGFSKAVYVFHMYSGMIISIFELAYNIFLLVVVIALLKKYSPKHYFVLSLLSLFFPLARYIIIFVLRNKPPINYDAYMRRQRAEYIRRQQQYYNQFGNPYANGYGNGNPYGAPQANQGNPSAQNPQNQQPADSGDPFEEFSSKPQTPSGSSADTKGGDKDEFFN